MDSSHCAALALEGYHDSLTRLSLTATVAAGENPLAFGVQVGIPDGFYLFG